MKKLCALLFLILAFGSGRLAHAASEEIQSFNAVVDIRIDGSLEVEETLNYYFPTQRHGIYRTIPTVVTNSAGKKLESPISVVAVVDEKNRPYKYTATEHSGLLTIKIGDPDRYVTGLQTYKITYTASDVAEAFSDHDEVYWNITGNGWEIPIKEASVRFNLSDELAKASVRAVCFTGPQGSTSNECSIETSAREVTITTQNILASGSGLTVVLGFDKDILSPTPKTPVKDYSTFIGFLMFVWYVLIPGAVLLIYFKFGRDPKINTAIPALFDYPKDAGVVVDPAMAGTLTDEVVTDKEITALIVSLAIRGFLKITEAEDKGFLTSSKKYILERTTKQLEENMQPYEIALLAGLFKTGDITDTKALKDKFYKEAKDIQDTLYKESVKRGYFTQNPDSVRAMWFLLGAVAVFTINIPFGIISIVMAKAMPRKTHKGVMVKIDVIGLKKFLVSQERQLEFQEENWHMFEKFLPYAIALDVTATWAKRFESLGSIPSESTWFVPRAGMFVASDFAGAMSSFGSSMAYAATPTRSSSGMSSGFGGGGFSGGGGGGGGGGSW